MITTCSRCGKLYEAGSEEQAYESDRLCPACFKQDKRNKTINTMMHEMVQKGLSKDVTKIGHEIVRGLYKLDSFEDGVDYCDPEKNLWIWSIGKNLISGEIFASTDTRYYGNPYFECLWLR
jgi:hypothetical protein